MAARKRSQSRAPRRGKRRAADPERQLTDAALRLAAVQGWADTTLPEIAEEAGLPLAEAVVLFPSKLALLAAFTRRIDLELVAGTDPSVAAEPLRDRLFDVLMRRFDALRPHRDGLRAVQRDLARDPAALACFAAGPMRRALETMLMAARVPPWGPLQPLQIKGFGLIYLAAFRAFLGDEGEDLSATMAAVDRGLRRADSLLGMLPGRRRRRDEAADGGE